MKSGGEGMNRTLRLGYKTFMLSRLAWYNDPVIDKKLSEYFSALGRKSAKAKMKQLSAKERQEIARNAARARWAKAKKRKKRRTGRKP
jgi:hypothetical protein